MSNADQLIYTRVVAAYSPTSVEGFQVVHRSAGLIDNDLEQMTPLFEGIPYDTGDQRRYQFFRLTDGRVALSRGGVVRADPKITGSRQKSVLLSHTIVLPAADFKDTFANEPFELLDQGDLWVTSPKEMERKFARQGAIVSPANVDRDPDSYAPQDPIEMGWQPAEWKKLVSLARNAAELVAAGKTVFLRGSPDEAAEVLRALLPAVRSKKRAACTFDTAWNGTSVRRDYHPEGFASGALFSVAATNAARPVARGRVIRG